MKNVSHTLFSRGKNDRALYACASDVFGKERIPRAFILNMPGGSFIASYTHTRRDREGDVEFFEFKTGGFKVRLFND